MKTRVCSLVGSELAHMSDSQQTAHTRPCCRGLGHRVNLQKSLQVPPESAPINHSLSMLTARSQHLGLVWSQEHLGFAQVPDSHWTQGAELPLQVPAREVQLAHLSLPP